MGNNEGDQIEKTHSFIEIDSSSFECESDDSEDDPSFDIENEVRNSFSRLSFTKKSKPRITKVTEVESSEEAQDVDITVPELGEEDQKSFEAVQKKIEGGQLEKLKVDQCKVYLRKYGLRLTGNKETLLQRIKEHLEVVNSGGEIKYPPSSFVFNCKGDACMGDVVLFEQNVYEIFSIASRSATGPPCGTRMIAGRIVKESYGAAKQQHTFTIEVLWSKGVKPLPPLHPLLIKGRNLYRLKTMRQKWVNEGERQKILLEKHSRGDLARSTREVRIKEKEKRLNTNRAPKMEKPTRKKEENNEADNQFPSVFNSSGVSGTHPQESQNILRKEPTIVCPTAHSFPNQNQGQSMEPIRTHHQFQRQHVANTTSSTYQNQNHRDGTESSHSAYQFQNRRPLMNTNRQTHLFQQRPNYMQNGNSFQNQGFEQKQICKFYAQGRCYYGDRCKWRHEKMEYHNNR